MVARCQGDELRRRLKQEGPATRRPGNILGPCLSQTMRRRVLKRRRSMRCGRTTAGQRARGLREQSAAGLSCGRSQAIVREGGGTSWAGRDGTGAPAANVQYSSGTRFETTRPLPGFRQEPCGCDHPAEQR